MANTDDQATETSAGTWFDLRDGFAVVGLGLLAGGFYLVWLPATLLVPGALLFWLAVRR